MAEKCGDCGFCREDGELVGGLTDRCYAEPRLVSVTKDRPACRFFKPKTEIDLKESKT